MIIWSLGFFARRVKQAAPLIGLEGIKVILRTDEGREITLEIDKRTDNNRQILARVPKGTQSLTGELAGRSLFA